MSRIALIAVIVSFGCLTERVAEAQKRGAKRKKPQLKMTVTTKTGRANRYAKSNNQGVYVLINGSDEHKFRLDNPKKDDFERGATDRFENLTVKVPIEEIESIRLKVTGKDMWKCDSIHFQFYLGEKKSRLYRFNPKRYMSAEKERSVYRAVKSLDFKVSPQWVEKRQDDSG